VNALRSAAIALYVLVLDAFIDFFAVDTDFLGGLDSHPDLGIIDRTDGDFDIIPDD